MSTDDKIQVNKETEDAPKPQLEIEDPTKVLDPINTDTQKDHHEEENNHEDDEYTDDDDSEYTYETISDDDDEEEEEENNEKPKKKGWFGFLKRGNKQSKEDDDDESENEEEDIIAALDNHKQILSEEDSNSVSSDDEHGKHHLLNSPQTIHPTISSSDINTNKLKLKQQEKDEEERLMAQAVQRVQQRIVQSGGNLYDALDEHDKQLVDELKGINDVRKIKEVVDKSIDAEFGSGGKERGDDMKEETESPVIDVKPSVENNKERSNNQQEQSLLDNESSSDDDDEESEDEEPTIVEKQSLLSLAAEHDRVDVIKELLTVGPSLNQFEHDLLLQGVSSVTSPRTMFLEGGRLEAIFIPPPLHVAVAHGSSNAASCLLRMRECDPSIRPQVPKQYLLGGYDDGRSPSKGSVITMKEDRNYKKYQDMSAWELAFGGTAVTVIVGDPTQVEDTDMKEEVEEPKRGWFGFGSSSKIEEEEPVKIENVIINGVSKQRRIKRRVPLNIPPSKLDGIQHAFTAEALRAIGSDEVDRVKQLVDAGMDGSLDVGGKTLFQWAVELDAKECCELFKASMEEEVDNDTQKEARKEVSVDIQANDNGQANAASSPDKYQQSLPTHDERLAGLSLSDIQTLTTENLNLIPALTTCGNDLSSEAQICQSILRDVMQTGGKGGLESQSLLQLVRTLKEQRAEADEAANAWQKAWEEREDELDFFVEEILDDVHRNELLPILDQVEPIDPSMQGLTLVGSTANNMEEAVKRFIEVDNHVNVLRTQINNLADDKYMPEIEKHGLMGALTLTRSLRDEVKEVEKKINLAMMGEGMCRRKIEIIQQRLGGEEVKSGSASQEYEGHNQMNGDSRAEEEDYQLQAIAKQHEQPPPSPPVKQVSERLPPSSPEEGGHDDDQYVHVSPEDDGSSDEYSEEMSAASEDEQSFNEEEISASADASNGIIEEESNIKEEEVATQELRSSSTIPDHQANQDIRSPHDDVSSASTTSVDRKPSKAATIDNSNKVDKPSVAISQGKSTAIVVHSPNIQGTLTSQIWEILRRIVGLSRAPSSRSQSYNDVESNPHVMTV